MLRATLTALVLLATTLLVGCPRDVQVPDPGEDATPCAETADCNAGATCGQLKMCVDGLCEATPSLAIPCPTAGAPVPATAPATP